jgi:hypothetical protein
MQKVSQATHGAPRAATGHYPFRDHRSVAQIDAENRELTLRFAEGRA